MLKSLTNPFNHDYFWPIPLIKLHQYILAKQSNYKESFNNNISKKVRPNWLKKCEISASGPNHLLDIRLVGFKLKFLQFSAFYSFFLQFITSISKPNIIFYHIRHSNCLDLTQLSLSDHFPYRVKNNTHSIRDIGFSAEFLLFSQFPKLWPAAGCEAKVVAELSSRPLYIFVSFFVSLRFRRLKNSLKSLGKIMIH